MRRRRNSRPNRPSRLVAACPVNALFFVSRPAQATPAALTARTRSEGVHASRSPFSRSVRQGQHETPPPPARGRAVLALFVAIKMADGRGSYVRVSPEMAETLQERDRVRVGFEAEPWLKPADRIIAKFAGLHSGVYDPVRHQRDLEELRGQPNHRDEPSPADRVTANIRRLDRLARYRLATRLGDGRWQVPADLLRQLEAREQTHPQHRLRLESVGAPTRAPSRTATIDRVTEREALGRALGQQRGLVYVSEPSAFQGRVIACRPTASGREYLGVIDERVGQLTLIAKPAGADRLEGRIVRLTRDRERGLSIAVDRGISR